MTRGRRRGAGPPAAATIRRASAADAAAVLGLERHFPGDRMSVRSIRHFLRASTAVVLVTPASTAAPIAGALVLLFRTTSRTARIYSVVVGPDARGQGLGAALVRAAEAAARLRGCTAMALEVRADNAAARAMYARLGYATAARLPGYYEDGVAGLRLRKEWGR